jgi:hypothetical protein
MSHYDDIREEIEEKKDAAKMRAQAWSKIPDRRGYIIVREGKTFMDYEGEFIPTPERRHKNNDRRRYTRRK